MPKFVRSVQPPLRFIPAAYNPWVMRAVHLALPLLLRVRIRPWLPAGISHIEVKHVERLVDLYAQFEANQARFLMAVRHVEVDDPLSGLYLCSRAVSKAAKAKGIKLRQPVHTHFIYERGMTIWAGRTLGWLLSRMGGTPIRRGRKPDWVGLKAARRLLTEGDMPMVVAPEGATNGHSERLGPLEPGVAQLGFWCAEDLQKSEQESDRAKTVFIAPIGIQYRYAKPNWTRLQRLLSRLEAQSGLSNSKQNERLIEKECQLRIQRLGEHLIEKMEQFYERVYPQLSGQPAHSAKQELAVDTEQDGSEQSGSEQSSAEPNNLKEQDCSQRLQQLLDRALKVSEQFFNLPSRGTLVDRCRRIEEASWNLIYREDLPPLDTLSPIDRGLADWAAQTASLHELHMRIVESFVAADSRYLSEKPSFERCAELSLLMSDMIGRLNGEKLPQRPRLGLRWVQVTVALPIEVTSRLTDYQQSRKAGRQAVAALTEDIRLALEKTIERK